MMIFGLSAEFSAPRLREQILAFVLSAALLLAALPQNLAAANTQEPPASQTQASQQGTASAAAQYVQQSPEQIQQLVAPIALYPDSLVAQVLAASTFPEQIVEADRWVQAHPGLTGDALGQAIDQQDWDPSIKAIAAFPSVLGNMDKNLSWTSSLGDAYYNQEQDVMDAIQVMRQKAQEAGNLKTTEQQTVSTQDNTIVIQPANPTVVYVPAYNPWLIYGGPIGPWPGWYPYPGIWYGGPYLSFGVGFGIGFFGGYGWGWNSWGFNWHNHYAIYNNSRYYSRSTTFYNRNAYYRGRPGGFNGRAPNGGAGYRPPSAYAGSRGVYNHPGVTTRPFDGDSHAARGYAPPPARSQPGTRTGAFAGYDHGGQTRSYSSRGSASMGGAPHGGGGGAPHGGGGGSHH